MDEGSGLENRSAKAPGVRIPPPPLALTTEERNVRRSSPIPSAYGPPHSGRRNAEKQESVMYSWFAASFAAKGEVTERPMVLAC